MRYVTKEELLKSKKNAVMSENQTIASIIKLAREQGVEDKVKGLILKFQDAVKSARTEYERKHIAAMGIAEIHKTIGCVGGLVVDGIEILPPDTSWQEDINAQKSVVKLD
jgi:fructose-1,6-bisphosphatase